MSTFGSILLNLTILLMLKWLPGAEIASGFQVVTVFAIVAGLLTTAVTAV